jgi:uncharacterized protein YecE (DUF72 family)
MANAHIGTSGWHYKHWRGPYYPASVPPRAMLDYYARDFDTVEVNNSFYRLPPPATFEAWSNAAPANFCFAVKGSRYLTHAKRLMDPEPAIERLMDATRGLGVKRGPILFQLPPKWHCNLERLERFLKALPSGVRYSMEFRDPSWHNLQVFRLLCKHQVAFCLFELAGFLSPMTVTADFVYVRLHGPGNKYQGDYSPAVLRSWARRIRRWTGQGLDVYLYFDNDQNGYAAQNARDLKQMLSAPSRR